MKKREVRIKRRILTYRHPISTSYGTMTNREVVLFSLNDGKGNWGHGEASPLRGFSLDSLKNAELALSRWAAGSDEALHDSVTATAALDSAQLDLQAQAAGIPLYQYFNSNSVNSIPVAALLVGNKISDLESATIKAINAGYKTIKIKVGGKKTAEDIQRIKTVREVSGYSVSIRIDANRSWPLAKAIKVLEKLAPLKIEFIEEPVDGNLDDLTFLTSNTEIPVAVDESSINPTHFMQILESEAADIVVVKPSAIGGLSEANRRIQEIRNANRVAVITSMLEGAIGITGAAHLAAATGSLQPASGLATSTLISNDTAPTPRIFNGFLNLSENPGLGIKPF